GGFGPGGFGPGGGFRGGQGGPMAQAGGTGTAPGVTTGTPGAVGMGGLLDAGSVSDAAAAALSEDASSYTWVAATIGANNAAGYQLATELPVMPIGGFNGTDPSPTLQQFEQWVSEGKIHWFIAGGVGMGGDGGSSTAAQITSWVGSNFSSTTVGGVTMYDLTDPS
ncbi:MAG: glycosyl transferase, partial [Geminicoccaceae bacterium]